MASAKLECRWCHAMVPVKELRSSHGKNAPSCVAQRTMEWASENGYRAVGNFSALLREAGIVKSMPVIVKMWEPVDADGRPLPPGSGSSSPDFVKWTYVYTLEMCAFAPRWAYDLAKKLSQDRGLARALGFTQKRKREAVYEDREFTYYDAKPSKAGRGTKPKTYVKRVVVGHVWKDVDLDKLLPMELRVKIMKIAANNELAREMIDDDPAAAGRIIKDLM